MSGVETGKQLIDECITESERAGETYIVLKHVAMGIVHQAMADCYGEDYSIRCMECSMGINRVLSKWGMDGPIVMGAMCIPHIGAGGTPADFGWAGFWGTDHHFWSMTKHKEVVDLAMSQNHLHPATIAKRPLQPPAIWIDVHKPWVNVIQHLPYKLMGEARSTDEQDRMSRFLIHVDGILSQFEARAPTPEGVRFTAARLVTESEDLNRLSSLGDPWCSQAHVFQKLPKPDWVVARTKELETGSLESRLVQPDFTAMER